MPQGLNRPNRSAVFIDLGLLEYGRALDLQKKTLLSKIDNPRLEDRILFVEHPSVYTLGKRGGKENLIVSREFLQSRNIDIVQTDRGGDITYHGPGQAVMYPIVDLEKNKIGVKEFVHGLEEIMKLTAREFNIDADRNPKNHGIWVKNSKIGSIGISIKRGISFHGLAMNITPDLEPFSWINPCGLTNVSMTSIEHEMVKQSKKNSKNSDPENDESLIDKGSIDPVTDPIMNRVKDLFIKHFSSVFSYTVKLKNEN